MMKLSMPFFALLSFTLSFQAKALETENGIYRGQKGYECIAGDLQALDSDLYYNMTPEDIDAILQTPGMGGYPTVVAVTNACDKQGNYLLPPAYKCMITKLIQISINYFEDITARQIDGILKAQSNDSLYDTVVGVKTECVEKN